MQNRASPIEGRLAHVHLDVIFVQVAVGNNYLTLVDSLTHVSFIHVLSRYTPSAALAGVALATFGIVFIAHSFYSFRCRRTRLFQFLLAFGCVSEHLRSRSKNYLNLNICSPFGQAMELVGYGFRIGSNKNPFLVIDFVIQVRPNQKELEIRDANKWSANFLAHSETPSTS